MRATYKRADLIGFSRALRTDSLHLAAFQAGLSWSDEVRNQADTTIYTNPNFNIAEQAPNGDLINTILPEQNATQTGPDGPVNDTLGVQLQVFPQVPDGFTAELWVKVFDPDNYADGDYDINDGGGPTAEDNYTGVLGDNAPSFGDIGAGLGQATGLDGNGHVKGAFSAPHVKVSIPSGKRKGYSAMEINASQPGNNWQLAGHDELSVLKDLTFDAGHTLIRKRGENSQEVPVSNRTMPLVAQRTLWIEVDQMPDPEPFMCHAVDNDPGDPCAQDRIDENGTITVLEEHLAGTGVIPRLAIFNANATLPNFIEYGEETPGMQAPTGKPSIARTAALVRDAKQSEHFWSVQVVAGHQSNKAHDGDQADSSFGAWYNGGGQPITVGYSYGKDDFGPAVVYMEELRDLLEGEASVDIRGPSPSAVTTAHDVRRQLELAISDN